MVRYRKPVERSENIIDLRGLTNEQAKAVIAARDKLRQMEQKRIGSKWYNPNFKRGHP